MWGFIDGRFYILSRTWWSKCSTKRREEGQQTPLTWCTMSALAALLGPTKSRQQVEDEEHCLEEKLNSSLQIWRAAKTRVDLAEAMRSLKAVVKESSSLRSSQACLDTSRKARENLAYLLLQEGHRAEAETLLKDLGYTYSLSDQVVRYGDKATMSAGSLPTVGDHSRYVRVFDNVFAAPIIEQLKTAFRLDSPFWSEHKYPCPYFSYAHSYNASATSAKHLIEQIAQIVHRQACLYFPECKTASHVEWWAHNRVHCHGHQLHFDSDNEGVGEVRNPICSSILYLSSDGIGGPTLVTTQTLESKSLASNGWLVHPKENCLGIFDGKVLHGVIPGRGIAKQSSSTELPRRITLMFAFWKGLKIRPCDDKNPGGASRSFPPKEGQSFTWTQLLQPSSDLTFLESSSVNKEVPLPSVCPIWQKLARQHSEKNPVVDDQCAMPEYNECFQYPVQWI